MSRAFSIPVDSSVSGPAFANSLWVDYAGLTLALLPHVYFNWVLVRMLTSFSLDPQSTLASVAA